MRLEQKLKPKNPEFLKRVHEIFDRAPFIRDIGLKLESAEIGRAVTSLEIKEKHMQQNNFVHAGVLSTMADHTAGCAGGSLIAPDEVVLSVEYKINLLRPAIGESLRCEAQVLRNGKTLIIVDSFVYATQKGREKLTARATVTLAVVGSSYD
ncbi:MAG: PaaI family thioesterase [Spirochaetia bacterium]|nr:PaaI family thioesterase [Spirochaetia bacterium]